MAFTTCGYGDFAPSTPAGRSVFVVWALLGVGTMTILISGKYSHIATFRILTSTRSFTGSRLFEI